MSELNNGVNDVNNGEQNGQTEKQPPRKKPNLIVRAGQVLWSGIQRFHHSKVGKAAETVGGVLLAVQAGWEINEHQHGRDAAAVVVTGGNIEAPEDEIPEEEEPIDQPEETGNDEMEATEE